MEGPKSQEDGGSPPLALSDVEEPNDVEDPTASAAAPANQQEEGTMNNVVLSQHDGEEEHGDKAKTITAQQAMGENENHSNNDDKPLLIRRYSLSNMSEATKPDPPPSVVDYEEDREDLDDLDDRGTRDVLMTEDENRIEGRVLHAVLSSHVRTMPVDASQEIMIDVQDETAEVPEPTTMLQTEEQNQAHQETIDESSGIQSPLPQSDGNELSLTPDHAENIPLVNLPMEASNMAIDAPADPRIVSSEHPLPSSIALAPNSGIGHLVTRNVEEAPSTPPAPAMIHQPPSFLLSPHQQQQSQQQHSSSFLGNPAFGQPQASVVRGSSFGAPPTVMMVGGAAAAPCGRRKIRLRMEEEPASGSSEGSRINNTYDEDQGRPGLLRSIRRKSRLMFGSGEILSPISESKQEHLKPIDRGVITLSWFEGTTSMELQEHVRKSVTRKLKLPKHIQLIDVRVLDESSDPPFEEIVLSPYIPHGSEFLLRFSTRDTTKQSFGTESPIGRPPDSPSAAPSPHPETGQQGGLSSKQLAHLSKKLDALRPTENESPVNRRRGTNKDNSTSAKEEEDESGKDDKKSNDEESTDDDEMVLHSEDPIEARLRQITELLLRDREESSSSKKSAFPRHGRRQVIFVLANYFVLFLSLIAISAEIQARAPEWLVMLEKEMKNVQNCAADQDALFECVSRGDFAGLIASCMLWLSRSVATRRIFLFGFETPKKLWTVVYESMVTAVCWGFSYLFIRRGMNPDTRHRFLQKFWKDAVYGSLAGFNAAFMKQILKNLIPQEAVEDALRERQLKILSWLPNFS